MKDDKTNNKKPRQIRLISEFDSLSKEEKEKI